MVLVAFQQGNNISYWLQLKVLQEKVDEERENLKKECETEKGEIRRQWQKLNDEIKRMEEIHNLQQVIVRVVRKVTAHNIIKHTKQNGRIYKIEQGHFSQVFAILLCFY